MLPRYVLGLLILIFSLIYTPHVEANSNGVQVSNVRIPHIGLTSATITWTTDIPADSQIRYGKSSVDEFNAGAVNVSDTSHSVTLLSLSPATKYVYQVTSSTPTGLSGSSQQLSFVTNSFSFDDSSVGNFAELNATPTPTPYINPYAQSLPQSNTMPQYYGGYTQPPVYLVPPVIYPQTSTNAGQTLGAQQEAVAAAVPATTDNSELTSLMQTGMWGIIALFFIVVLCFTLIVWQFQKNRKELRTLQRHIQRSNRQQTNHQVSKKRPKTYSFDVG